MAMQSFTRNYQDNSTESGFEFVFDCDNCGDGFTTSFVECRSYKRGNLFRTLGEGIGAGARMLGLHDIGIDERVFQKARDHVSSYRLLRL
jgi:hypothetical protein